MTEGDGNSAVAAVDSSDVFNPKQTCRNCGTSNDVSITICTQCGEDVYGTDKTAIEIEDTSAMLNGKTKDRKSLGNVFFDKKIAAPAPTLSEELVVVQNEGMMDIEHIEDFLDDDLIDEGRKDRNGNNNNAQQNLNGNNNISGNRPLFTTILVIYWLYYLVWFVVGIILTFFSWIGVNEAITTICMILPSLIMLILMSRISCLNSVNINNINHYWNLNENQKQKYKLISILITTLLLFGALLRAVWWIYCIAQYVNNQNSNYVSSNRLSITLVSLLINELGIIILINIDYLKMAHFERNLSKQGIFGIVNNPYPCLISLSILVTIQLWILSYGSFSYKPNSECNWWIAYVFECGLNVIYILTAIITIIIPIAYAIKIYIKYRNENENNHNHHNGFVKLNKIEQYFVIGILASLMLLTFIMALSIFAGFQEAYTWIHLLLLPQLFGVMWALFKLRKLSQV